MKKQFQQNGYHLLKGVLPHTRISELIEQSAIFSKQINHYGVRHLMKKMPLVRELATSSPLFDIAREILGRQAKPVRSVYFDKTPEANWSVAWHQDTSIALKAQCDVPGFRLWSVKQGVIHVEPPEKYLTNLLTLRIHLDPANTDNGVLRVVPGSHRYGRVPSREIIRLVNTSCIEECTADPGDVLLMSPLLFHASRKAVSPNHRRIIHLEYSAMDLPKALAWFEDN